MNFKNNFSKKYSILGGVVAPKQSAYPFRGMPNPNMEKALIPMDRSLPSLRDQGATGTMPNFNPYGGSPTPSKEIRKNMNLWPQKYGHRKFITSANTSGIYPVGTPLLGKKGTY